MEIVYVISQRSSIIQVPISHLFLGIYLLHSPTQTISGFVFNHSVQQSLQRTAEKLAMFNFVFHLNQIKRTSSKWKAKNLEVFLSNIPNPNNVAFCQSEFLTL